MKKRRLFIITIGIILLVLIALNLYKKVMLSTQRPPVWRAGLTDDYWTYTDVPDLTDKERSQKYCKMSDEQWEEYYQEKDQEAKELSSKLEQYIKDWYYGKADAKIPKGFLPPSIDNEKTKEWTLQRPEEIDPEKQWYYWPAHEIDPEFKKLAQNSPDNHATYLKLLFLAPLDSQLLIEGDFPYARFMDYQILEPFDPRFPVTGNIGVMEVSIVDVDIEPDLGNVNPFRIGADRRATNRHYHLTFDLKAGNAAELNPVMKNPNFRAPGNTRVAGPFGSTGPYGDGVIIPSVLWVRYYAPDKNVDALGGVSLPKVLLKLKTGETFWFQPDATLAIERQKTPAVGTETPPQDPPRFLGSQFGWWKLFGIYQMFTEAIGYYKSWPNGILPSSWVKKLIRENIECYFSQGPEMLSPGNIAHSATDCAYINYLNRVMFLGKDKVYAITGKMPTTPKTRDSEPTMEKAEARFFSFCHMGGGKDNKYHGALYGCLMDDEITVDAENNYLIVYSRGAEKPANAKPECGVTWQNFGPESRQAYTYRWMSVYPDHYMEEFAPNDENIPWKTGAWSQDKYDKSLVGENKPGVMGPYQPIIHYLTKEEFESLGCPVDPKKVPKWR